MLKVKYKEEEVKKVKSKDFQYGVLYKLVSYPHTISKDSCFQLGDIFIRYWTPQGTIGITTLKNLFNSWEGTTKDMYPMKDADFEPLPHGAVVTLTQNLKD
jgi:hypothetical protein